ncbi:MAG: YbaB/EbfC family nucleoid-associated protein [Caldimicrobium sp.]|nr:YbaB/EbfC family nucleoid-associated protein [Caldimicrobium sp.]MCX7874006.1 YbaB/EbfC family nucleoid-associated protein [Caldimicrobium sp.]MDW8094154.1 YbaB/EbfC family nucleoid-associated protein [Caldimicrobium sp.]
MTLPKELQRLFKEVQRIQKKMEETTKELEEKIVTAQVGGGMVRVTVNGRQEVLSIEIEEELLKPEEREMLQDLLVAGVNEALKKAKALLEEELAKVTGGLALPPGFKLPGF